MIELQIILTWTATGFYLVGCIAAWIALLWKSERLMRYVPATAAAGLAVHSVPLAVRWYTSGHGPYLTAFELLSSNVWIGVTVFLIGVLFFRRMRWAAGPVLAISVLLLGWGVTTSPEVHPLPATFKGVWLVIHILTAQLAYGAIVVASGLSVLYLIKSHRQPLLGDPAENERFPRKRLDRLSFRLIALGFVFIAFMIGAGAIWARNAWGSYWNWDPIETWSLITLVAYGLFLHLRIAFKVRDQVWALAIIGLLILSLLTFFGVVLWSATEHTEFMVR